MKNKRRKFSIVILILFLIGAYLGYTIYFKDDVAVSPPASLVTDHQSLTGSSNTDTQASDHQVITSSAEKKPQEEIFLMGTAAECEKVHKWYVGHGYYGLDDNNQTYMTYDQAMLEKLAASGDLRAMDALGNIYVNEKNLHTYGFNAAKQQHWNSAVWGSTFAFVKLAIRHEVGVFDWAKTEEEKRSAALEVLSLYEAGVLRGEKWLNVDGARSFRHLQSITLSEPEQKFINERAHQIYSELQKERYKLGLGDFDNSVSPEVEKFYKTLEREDKDDEKRRKAAGLPSNL